MPVLVRQLGPQAAADAKDLADRFTITAISSMPFHAGGVSRADYCDAQDCTIRRRPDVPEGAGPSSVVSRIDEDAVERARERFAKLRGEF
jgi:hypothetical protein